MRIFLRQEEGKQEFFRVKFFCLIFFFVFDFFKNGENLKWWKFLFFFCVFWCCLCLQSHIRGCCFLSWVCWKIFLEAFLDVILGIVKQLIWIYIHNLSRPPTAPSKILISKNKTKRWKILKNFLNFLIKKFFLISTQTQVEVHTNRPPYSSGMRCEQKMRQKK